MLLPYSIELWDPAAKAGLVWVKVDVKGNSTQSIKMTFGDPNAMSASDGKAVRGSESQGTGSIAPKLRPEASSSRGYSWHWASCSRTGAPSPTTTSRPAPDRSVSRRPKA